MQTKGRGKSKRKFGKIGLSILGVIVFTASHAWAAPFTGALEGAYSWTPFPGSNSSTSAYTYHGYTTTHGAVVCHGAFTSAAFVQEPTGACGEAEVEVTGTGSYYCQFEGTEDILNATGTGTTCVPSSCYDENQALQVPCPFTAMESVTATGGTGTFEGSSGSWTSSATGTYTQAEVMESGALFLTATLSAEVEGDIELADGSVPKSGVALGIPSSGTNVSGIGLISGWSCLGGELEVEFSDADGVIETITVLQGTERPDTAPRCGDTKNGFSATYNWSRLGAGEKTARLMRNGEEVASSTFMVTAFDVEFVTGAEGMCTIADFPDMGKNATFVWEQSRQGLVLESVN